MLVADGIVRCRYRESFRKPVLLERGMVVRLEIDLWDTSIVFSRGHRIRLSICGSNSPRYDVNPNTGRDSWKETRPVVAENTIYFNAERPSHLLLPVVK
jgi:putative CocE/NonD family hydrolase